MSEQQIRPKNPPVTITPNKFPGNSNMAKRLNPSESEPTEKPKVEPVPLKGSVSKRKKNSRRADHVPDILGHGLKCWTVSPP